MLCTDAKKNARKRRSPTMVTVLLLLWSTPAYTVPPSELQGDGHMPSSAPSVGQQVPARTLNRRPLSARATVEPYVTHSPRWLHRLVRTTGESIGSILPLSLIHI